MPLCASQALGRDKVTYFCFAFPGRYSRLECALVSVLVTTAGMRPLERLRYPVFSTLSVLQIVFARQCTASTHPLQPGELKVAQLEGCAMKQTFTGAICS